MAAFPRPEARSLTGRRYVLPDDFAGNFTIVLLAFEMLADWSDSDYNVNPYLPTTAARLNRFNVNR